MNEGWGAGRPRAGAVLTWGPYKGVIKETKEEERSSEPGESRGRRRTGRNSKKTDLVGTARRRVSRLGLDLGLSRGLFSVRTRRHQTRGRLFRVERMR